MIDRRGTRELVNQMKRDITRLKGTVTATHRNLVKTMFLDLVAHTPQWSGELAMHWGIEVHGSTSPAAYSINNPGWERRVAADRRDPEPYQMGSDPAVSITVARELKKIESIRYNSNVRFVNRMPYAEEVERGVGPNGKPIRDVNRLASYGGVAMVGYLDAKYRNLNQIRKAIR